MNTASRNKLLEELNRETEYYSRHTRNQYFSHVNTYLDYVGGGNWRDRDTLYLYAKKLRKTFGQAHVNYMVRGPIGALFRAHGLAIPIKLPRVQISGLIHDLTAGLQFDADEIAALIKAARQLSGEHQAALALATVYGPRVSEIAHIKPDDVHPKKKTLVIHTAKFGVVREHFVPPQVAGVIFGFSYPFASINQLYKLFEEIREKAGLPKVRKKNFHAIRHGVCTELIHGAKIRSDAVYMFLRWRGAGMLAAYAPFHPDNDQEIFDKHPFLKFWE